MLILSRHKDEDIVFPKSDIVVRVIEIRGDKVRMGIQAPAAEPVHRREVWEQIEARVLGAKHAEATTATP